MPNEFWMIVAGGAVVAVLLALIFGRSFKIRWGGLFVKTEEAKTGANQIAQASGARSSVTKVRQTNTTGVGKQEVTAEEGGRVADVNQKEGKQGK